MTRWHRILLAAFLLLTTTGAASAEPKRVLLLHSFGSGIAPWSHFSANVREEIGRQSAGPVDVFELSLVTARSADVQEAPFVDYLRSLFASRRLDLVITVGAPAAGFWQRNRQTLFPATPAIFAGLEQRRVPAGTAAANATVIAVSIDYLKTLENVLQVLPETTQIAIVIGNSPLENLWREQFIADFRPIANRTALVWWSELSFDEMLKRAATLPAGSAIFFIALSVDAAGVSPDDGKVLDRLHAVAKAPLFSPYDSFFGQGVLGGPMIDILGFSRRTASVATRILGGEAPAAIGISPIEMAAPKYDWRELKRWNVSEARLPAGSEIHFREPSLWEQYRWQTSAVVAAIVLQSLLITGLLFEHRRRRTVEVDLRHRVLEVAHLNRTATAGVMSASIAHELNQPLGAILLNTETVDMLLQDEQIDRKQLEEIIAEIRRDDQRAASIIKGLSAFLKKKGDVELHQLDLNETLQGALQIIEPVATRRGFTLKTDWVPVGLPVRADPVHLQQVVLNLTFNAMDAMQDMARPRSVVVQTSRLSESEATVLVSDNGPGIPDDKLTGIFETFYTTKKQGTGLGLSIARTIVELYGGKIWAENRSNGGATFIFTLPLFAARPDGRQEVRP